MTYDVLTFGEAMIRLAPPHHCRLEQTGSLEVEVGGSELNAAVAAQRMGLKTAFVTKLTRSPLGRLIENKARERGVDMSHAVWTDEHRIGLYFVEFGSAPRPNSVLYDRRESAIACSAPGDFDWDRILPQGKVFHTSGITPALSPSMAAITLDAVQRAKEAGLLVSIDLNYRERLWSRERARLVMGEILETADVLFTTEEDTERVFGITAASYDEVARLVAERFELDTVAITLRGTQSVKRNTWSAITYNGNEVYSAPTYEIEIVDRVGSGDSFVGGFLYGYLTEGPALGVRYGAAVSALKQTNHGDFCWTTREEVERVMSQRSLRIMR
jgi:2-dehydro-3-deoxygluconokinase